MAAGDQLWQRGISYGSGGSVMAAINGPGDHLRQPLVIRADQLLGRWVIARQNSYGVIFTVP